MDIGYPDIPQTKTLRGHIIFSEMWETVNALAIGDQNCIRKEVKAWDPAPDDYVVEDVLRERLHKWREMVQLSLPETWLTQCTCCTEPVSMHDVPLGRSPFVSLQRASIFWEGVQALTRTSSPVDDAAFRTVRYTYVGGRPDVHGQDTVPQFVRMLSCRVIS